MFIEILVLNVLLANLAARCNERFESSFRELSGRMLVEIKKIDFELPLRVLLERYHEFLRDRLFGGNMSLVLVFNYYTRPFSVHRCLAALLEGVDRKFACIGLVYPAVPLQLLEFAFRFVAQVLRLTLMAHVLCIVFIVDSLYIAVRFHLTLAYNLVARLGRVLDSVHEHLIASTPLPYSRSELSEHFAWLFAHLPPSFFAYEENYRHFYAKAYPVPFEQIPENFLLSDDMDLTFHAALSATLFVAQQQGFPQPFVDEICALFAAVPLDHAALSLRMLQILQEMRRPEQEEPPQEPLQEPVGEIVEEPVEEPVEDLAIEVREPEAPVEEQPGSPELLPAGPHAYQSAELLIDRWNVVEHDEAELKLPSPPYVLPSFSDESDADYEQV